MLNQNLTLNYRIIHISVILLICIGCVSNRNILTPVINSELKVISDKIIYSNIAEETHRNIVFNGAYEGYQCFPESENSDVFLEETNFDDYKSSKCVCYNYKVKTDQGNDLYVGFKNGYSLNFKICFDSLHSIVEQPNIDNLKLTAYYSTKHHIELPKVKSITANEIEQQSKFGRFPVLVYQINQERLIWKVKRYFGKLNVTVYEFDIDAETEKIINIQILPYKRSFWQWIRGTGI